MEHLIGKGIKTALILKEKPKKNQDEYNVILLNDDYTHMNCVVEIIMKVFHKNSKDANELMLQVHREGRGLAGVYSYDIAVTKVQQVKIEAEKKSFPLKAIVEPA